MGHGPARELESEAGPLPTLDPALAAKLTAVLDALDARDPEFKAARDEERLGLLIKQWNGTCREMDGYLRTIGKVLVQTHQLNLDIGSDGGGLAQKPFIEDLRMKFKKLQFKLDNDGTVRAVSGDDAIGSVAIDAVTYDTVLSLVVDWVAKSAAKV